MRILITAPASKSRWSGNRTTARRWRALLVRLGHRVRLAAGYSGGDYDVLVALHARKGAAGVLRFKRRFPDRKVVVALTGTDLYRDLPRHRQARRALALADGLVVLQERARRRLPVSGQRKCVVIYQSAEASREPKRREPGRFDACLLAHLRPVKDPLRAALAARDLPERVRLRVVHLGAGLDEGLARRARREAERNRRYLWLGEKSPRQALRVLRRCQLALVTSRFEGGSNALTEAIASRIPVIASRIDATESILGEGYPGLFPAGDTAALRALLVRAEIDRGFLRRLKAACARRAFLVRPAREREAWRRLLRER
jgi:putative glycosyltransferase (TIGR04348 family)